MNEIKVGDIVCLKSESLIEMTVTEIFVNYRLEATFWNQSKGEFQTITGNIQAFKKVSE